MDRLRKKIMTLNPIIDRFGAQPNGYLLAFYGGHIQSLERQTDLKLPFLKR